MSPVPAHWFARSGWEPTGKQPIAQSHNVTWIVPVRPKFDEDHWHDVNDERKMALRARVEHYQDRGFMAKVYLSPDASKTPEEAVKDAAETAHGASPDEVRARRGPARPQDMENELAIAEHILTVNHPSGAPKRLVESLDVQADLDAPFFVMPAYTPVHDQAGDFGKPGTIDRATDDWGADWPVSAARQEALLLVGWHVASACLEANQRWREHLKREGRPVEEGEGVLQHRDIKPGNILGDLTHERRPRWLLTDFNQARIGGAATVTGSGDTGGTAEFLAPEIMEHKRLKSFTEFTDVWALGVTLVHLWNHRGYPYRADPPKNGMWWFYDKEGGTKGSIADQFSKDYQRDHVLAGLPRAMRVVVAACLHPVPKSRPTMAQLADLIGRILGVERGDDSFWARVNIHSTLERRLADEDITFATVTGDFEEVEEVEEVEDGQVKTQFHGKSEYDARRALELATHCKGGLHVTARQSTEIEIALAHLSYEVAGLPARPDPHETGTRTAREVKPLVAAQQLLDFIEHPVAQFLLRHEALLDDGGQED